LDLVARSSSEPAATTSTGWLRNAFPIEKPLSTHCNLVCKCAVISDNSPRWSAACDLLPKKVTNFCKRFPLELTVGRSHTEAKAFTEKQIIRILKEHEASAKVRDLVREHGMSEQSFYRWKSKYGGMEVSEAKRLKDLEAENAKLKKLLAEAELDKAMLRDVLGKKW
jgi:putative transposase